MDQTPNLALPYLLAAQAQKHITHNEALRTIDALVQLIVLDKDLTAPPSSPIDGARYIVATGGSGAWAGQDKKIAAYQDAGWYFYTPASGWVAWVGDENVLYYFNGSSWVGFGTASINPAALVGVGTTADTTNRLAVTSPASLFSHVGGGHQMKVNKAALADTASLIFQTAFSGRAEVGLVGSDNLSVKVSNDGSAFTTAMDIDAATGLVSLPAGLAGGGRLTGMTFFSTVGASTWTKASSTRFALVFCLGGGGGGGGCTGATSQSAAGGGGGAGGLAILFTDVAAVPSLTVTVGAGGTGGTSAGGTGGTGGTSSFGSLCSATGGTGGVGQATGTTAAVTTGGQGGNGSGGSFNFTGNAGEYGQRSSASMVLSGQGGASFFGGAPLARSGAAAGLAGNGRGSGGSGSTTISATATAGGAGSAGLVWVWEFE